MAENSNGDDDTEKVEVTFEPEDIPPAEEYREALAENNEAQSEGDVDVMTGDSEEGDDGNE